MGQLGQGIGKQGRGVGAKLDEDPDQVPFREVWAIHGGDQTRLDPGAFNEFDLVIADPRERIGIHAIASINCVHDSEAHLVVRTWSRWNSPLLPLFARRMAEPKDGADR